MRERDEIGGATHTVDHELAIAERLPQREIEPVDTTGPDDELVPLLDVVAVLVDRNRRDTVEGGNALVVRDAGDAVAHRAVRAGHHRARLAAVGEAAPRPAVSVQVRALPGGAEARIRIQKGRARER